MHSTLPPRPNHAQQQPHELPQLPVEILCLIFFYLTRTRDILNIVQCSRTFRAIAEPMLYTHVNVKSTPRRAYLLNETLRSRSDLVGSIRKLALDARATVDLTPGVDQHQPNMPASSLRLRFSGLQAPVLSEARNLQSLDISFNPHPRTDLHYPHQQLHPHQYHQRSLSDPSVTVDMPTTAPEPTISLSRLINSNARLTKLTIHFHLSPFFLHELVRSVLRSQPYLKHLVLWNVSFLPGLLDTDVPNLETVVSGYPVAAQLTPTRRRITSLAVHADQGQDWRALDLLPMWLQSPTTPTTTATATTSAGHHEDPDAMDYETGGEDEDPHRLEDLSLNVQVTSPNQVQLLQSISDRAPDLVKLKLTVTFVAASTPVTDAGWNMYLFNMFIGMIPNFLSKFEKLQVLNLCGTRGFVVRPTMMYGLGFNYSTGDPDLDAERSRVTGWSVHCPTLREVVLPNGHRWVKERTEENGTFWSMATAAAANGGGAGGDSLLFERDEQDIEMQSKRFAMDLPWTSI